MMRLTDYGRRQYPRRWEDLGFVTANRVAGVAEAARKVAVVIWYNWATVKSREIFDNTDT